MSLKGDLPSFVKPPRWWRRWLRRLGVAFLVLTVLAVSAYGIFHYRVKSKLREAVEALDRDEPGWRLEEIEASRAAVSEEENGARTTVAAYALLPKVWQERQFGALQDALDATPRNE